MCWQTLEGILLMLKAATTFLLNNACSYGASPVGKFVREERISMSPSPIPPLIKSQEILFKMKMHLTRVPFDQNADYKNGFLYCACFHFASNAQSIH